MIKIEFFSTVDSVDHAHWLQFVTRYWKDNNGAVMTDITASAPKSYGTLYNRSGTDQWHVDSESLTEAFYDTSGGAHYRDQRTITIFDRPDVEREFNAKEVWATFETLLVSNDRVLYHVSWSRSGQLVNNVWTRQYTIGNTGPVNAMPDFGKADNLLIGYTTFNANANPPLSDKKEIANPIPAGNR